jgi:hypothetical protein
LLSFATVFDAKNFKVRHVLAPARLSPGPSLFSLPPILPHLAAVCQA